METETHGHYLGYPEQQSNSRVGGEVHLETTSQEFHQQCGEEGEAVQNKDPPVCVCGVHVYSECMI